MTLLKATLRGLNFVLEAFDENFSEIIIFSKT
jgi:hypothetical protein